MVYPSGSATEDSKLDGSQLGKIDAERRRSAAAHANLEQLAREDGRLPARYEDELRELLFKGVFRGVSRCDAEDLAQKSIWSALGTWKEAKGEFTKFLICVAGNKVKDHWKHTRRKTKRLVPLETVPEPML